MLQARPYSVEKLCNIHSIDLSIGCEFGCVYCYFSRAALKSHLRKNRNAEDRVIPLGIDDLLAADGIPNEIYFSYASDPLCDLNCTKFTRLLDSLLERGTGIFLITKGKVREDVLSVIKKHKRKVYIQIGLTNLDDSRNNMLEPMAPSSKERLKNLEMLGELDFCDLGLRMDPIFPVIDDDEGGLDDLISEARKRNVTSVVASYVLLSQRQKTQLADIGFLDESLRHISFETPTAHGTKYSAQFERKREVLEHLESLCNDLGMSFHVCSCKDLRLRDCFARNACNPRTHL